MTSAAARRAAALGLLAATAAGCATTPCDPSRDHNIFQVGGCVLGGGYQDRLDAKQKELADAEADQARAEAALTDAQAKQDRAAAAKARLQSDVAAQRVRSARLQNDINAARQNTNLNQQRLAQLQQKMDQLRAEQADLQQQANGGADVTAQLRAAQQRQRALEQQWDSLRTGAQE